VRCACEVRRGDARPWPCPAFLADRSPPPPPTAIECQHDERSRRRADRPGGRPRFHPRHRPRRSRRRPRGARDHPFPAGAERLPPHRPRQVDLPQLRRGPGVRRLLHAQVRRHQPDQGGARVHRGDPARRPLARLRLGRAPLLRLGLLRAALRLGRASDPQRQGLRRRPLARGDPPVPRHPHRARPRQPLPRAPGRGEPGPVPPHARRGVSRRRAGAQGQDRHGLRQHQPARPGALPHPRRRPPAHRHPMAHLPDLRLRPRPVGRHRGRHPFPLHAGVRGPPAALRLADREPAGALAALSVRVRPPQPDLHRALQAAADPARARGPRGRLGRPAHADPMWPQATRRAGGSASPSPTT
jgi:hypothetical protein